MPTIVCDSPTVEPRQPAPLSHALFEAALAAELELELEAMLAAAELAVLAVEQSEVRS